MGPHLPLGSRRGLGRDMRVSPSSQSALQESSDFSPTGVYLKSPVRQHIDATWLINGLIFLLAFPGLLWVFVSLDTWANKKYIEAGKAACQGLPSYEYLLRCDQRSDGVACTDENRTRLMDWYDPIDFACAKIDNDEPFVLPVSQSPVEEVDV